MSLELLAGNLIHGLLLGGVYGLAMMGLSLIFGVIKEVTQDEIHRIVDSAVETFLARYGR